MEETMQELREKDRRAATLSHAVAVLGWDQETYMPASAIDERSEQLELLQTMLHEAYTDPRIGELLARLGATDENPRGDQSLAEQDQALVRHVHRWYTRRTKLPADLVAAMARETSLGQSIWARARQESDFSQFAPQLEKLVDLTKQVAECLGYEEHPYDALLDEYEPWMKTSQVRRVFGQLQEDLRTMVQRIVDRPQVDDAFLSEDFAEDKQEAFCRRVLRDIGFDVNRGRMDVSAHPFTTSLGRDDVRITTRYSRRNPTSALFGTIHEAGHALYELGFGDAYRGSSLADGTSLGIHESQSRLWENMIGRSRPFWSYYYPLLQNAFPERLTGISADDFYRAVNKVQPSFIRVEADEVTYGLHIVLRFNLELALVNGDIRVADLPDAWMQTSRELLGISPTTDAEGVLQDIHWSMGGIGYFPTYALGNLYAAQFYHALRSAIPDLDEQLARGELSPVLDWLRSKVHWHGSSLTATELVQRVTGEDLNPQYFIAYLDEKYRDVYGY
jgi:carboxypeptidase Taq